LGVKKSEEESGMNYFQTSAGIIPENMVTRILVFNSHKTLYFLDGEWVEIQAEITGYGPLAELLELATKNVLDG
jgi:hypothetical protein